MFFFLEILKFIIPCIWGLLEYSQGLWIFLQIVAAQIFFLENLILSFSKFEIPNAVVGYCKSSQELQFLRPNATAN